MAGDREQVSSGVPVVDGGVAFGVDRGLEPAIDVMEEAESISWGRGKSASRSEASK